MNERTNQAGGLDLFSATETYRQHPLYKAFHAERQDIVFLGLGGALAASMQRWIAYWRRQTRKPTMPDNHERITR